jgi:hypothetical protein
MELKPWWKSKLIWTGLAMSLMGILPLINDLVKVISPDSLIITQAIIVFAGGIITVLLRIWFDQASPIDRGQDK